MVLVQLAASPKGRMRRQVVDPQHPERRAVASQPEAAEAVAGPLGLKERLRDDHAQPPVGLQ